MRRGPRNAPRGGSRGGGGGRGSWWAAFNSSSLFFSLSPQFKRVPGRRRVNDDLPHPCAPPTPVPLSLPHPCPVPTARSGGGRAAGIKLKVRSSRVQPSRRRWCSGYPPTSLSAPPRLAVVLNNGKRALSGSLPANLLPLLCNRRVNLTDYSVMNSDGGEAASGSSDLS